MQNFSNRQEDDNIFKRAADVFYGEARKKEKEEKDLRNSLLYELRGKLTPAQEMYADTKKLQEIKNGLSGQNSSNSSPAVQKQNDKQNNGRQNNENSTPYTTKRYCNDWENDKNFLKAMDFVFKSEGGYVNDKDDKGGETNLGITKTKYDEYNKNHGLGNKDIKKITKEEATRIYYEDFWKKTGANKIQDDDLRLLYFDTAILNGPANAKKFYRESNGNVDKFYELRDDLFKNISSNKKENQNKFKNGWDDRMKNYKKFVEENY